MITKFDTGSNAPSTGSSNTLLYVLLGGIALYLAYRFVIKPENEKRQEKEKQ